MNAPSASETVLLRALLQHIDGTELTLAQVLELVKTWLFECDRAAPLDGDYNTMHVAGAALCVVLDANALALPAPEDLGTSAVRERLFVGTIPIAEYPAPALQAFLANLQAEFRDLYTLTDDGYVCSVDLTLILLAVMRRLGYWLRHVFLPPPSDASLRDVAAPGPAGWHIIRPDVARHMLDVLHTMLTAHRILISAQLLPPATHACEIHPVHREASMDAWWELATVTDCPIGGITQYKNKFQYLFHSVSQVVYFHYPSYTRRNQRAFTDICAGTCPPLHILPLLMQVAPEIPLLYEHTGAGFRPVTGKNTYNWCVFGTFVVLVDQHMNSFCAHDFVYMLAYTNS
jgi:hypothetical protein